MSSYGTAAGFLAYHIARGREAVVDGFDDADEITPTLLMASEWVDATFGDRFPGYKVGQRAQIRLWPRVGALDKHGHAIASDVAPDEVDNATYEAALKELQAPGSLYKDWTPNKYRSVAVEGAVNVTYNIAGAVNEVQAHFASVEHVIAPVLTGSGADLSTLSGSTART